MSLAFWRADTKDTRHWSHWRNTGLNDRDWHAQGQAHRDLVHELCQLTKEPFPSWVLEWGCGGGMNAVAFADREYSCVDVSTANMIEARKQYEAAGGTKWTTRRITADGPNIDLFLSTATFQHFPSRRHGIRVLRAAYRIVRPAGLGLIQIRTYHKAFPGDTVWSEREFTEDVTNTGFRVVHTRTKVGKTAGDYIYFGLQK